MDAHGGARRAVHAGLPVQRGDAMRRGDFVTTDDGRRGFIRAVVAVVPPERERPIGTRFEIALSEGRGTIEMPPERLSPMEQR
jgi:hypothetical protein